MKKIALVLVAAIFTTVFAIDSFGGIWRWQPYAKKWWYDYGDGTWPSNQWIWADGNKDGVFECYYFDNEGYLLINRWTPDGYYVNDDGAWISGGAVQTRTGWNEYDPTSDIDDGDFDYDWGGYYYKGEQPPDVG